MGRLSIVIHTCNRSTWETWEVEWGQLGDRIIVNYGV